MPLNCPNCGMPVRPGAPRCDNCLLPLTGPSVLSLTLRFPDADPGAGTPSPDTPAPAPVLVPVPPPPKPPPPPPRQPGNDAKMAVALVTAVAAVVVIVVAVVLVATSGPDPRPVAGTAPATTTATTSTEDTTTTSSPALSARQLLENQVAQDRSRAEALVGRWLPQLSSKRPGVLPNGTTFDDEAIWADFTALRDRYPGALLVWSGAYRSFRSADYWVTLVPESFASAESANGWCDSEGIPAEDCYAKRLSHTGGSAENTRLRK
ncbi:zinc ribbon domain-containing protein [Amycolatopsis sacchari]|uniref:zinc ribbon domain-containing protein n=1 Tax=Amycolatopsis sacchari TaxID=115433 RepID=UPI003D70C8F7